MRRTGIQPAEFLNPLVPVGSLMLARTDPDYSVIVAALGEWGPKIRPAELRLADLYADRASATAAAKALRAGGKPAMPPDDPRLKGMCDIVEKLKPALKQWRADQRQLDDLIAPWRLAMETLGLLQVQAQQVQCQISSLALQASDPRQNQQEIQIEVRQLQGQLSQLVVQVRQAQLGLAQVEGRAAALRKDQARHAQQSDAAMEEWVRDCDVLGRLGPASHKKALAYCEQWIADEPRLWQPYLARGAARLQTGQLGGALADLARAGQKLAVYDGRHKVMAFITAVQAYALCRANDPRKGEKQFAEARKLDSHSWVLSYFMGWSDLQRGKYSKAKEAFQLALRNCDKAPQAEAHEAMALLLAACPAKDLRDGDKAVDHAVQACKLTKGRDWLCLDVLAAAYAESGDFDAAIRWAKRALDLAPAESRAPIRQRIKNYQFKLPYRLNAVAAEK